MVIPQERLTRYAHFVSLNSTNGQYDPNKGLEALLSSATPDPKVMVLRAMAANRNEWFFYRSELARAISTYLRDIGLGKNTFPISFDAGWGYCEKRENGNHIDGSLVKIGTVIKQVDLPTPSGPRTGYQISIAGLELGIPLGAAATEFVWQATRSGIEHRYDSMWRILGGSNSKTEKRRQLAVYYVVKYLVENEGYHREIDVKEALKGKVGGNTVNRVLNSLSLAGVIEYQSAARYVGGVRPTGWAEHTLSGKFASAPEMLVSEQIYIKLRANRPSFKYKRDLAKLLKFIKEHPKSIPEEGKLSQLLGIRVQVISEIISALIGAEVLNRVGDFRVGEVLSHAKATELTTLLYNVFLQPAWYSASTLLPYGGNSFDVEKARLFLNNFNDEKTQRGLEGGQEVRDVIMEALSDGNVRKVSYIRHRVNEVTGRALSEGAIKGQLIYWIKRRRLAKTKEGFKLKR